MQTENKNHNANADDISRFFGTLYGRCTDHGELIIIESFRRRQHCTAGDPDAREALASSLGRLDQSYVAAKQQFPDVDLSQDYYFKINPMDLESIIDDERTLSEAAGAPKRMIGGSRHVQSIVCLWADVDAEKDGYASRQDALRALEQMPVPPTVIVNSNGDHGGFHAYWCLREPHLIDDRVQVASMAARWQDRLKELLNGQLDDTHNLDRILRVPGMHRSNGNRVSIHSIDESALYTMDDLWLPVCDSIIEIEAERSFDDWLKRAKSDCGFNEEQESSAIDDALSLVPVADILRRAGWEDRSGGYWAHPHSKNKKSCRISIAGDGALFYSDCGGQFPTGGAFVHKNEIYTKLMHGGDWAAAYRECERITAPALEFPGIDAQIQQLAGGQI